jgi:DNA-binding transcriptional MocR family regulator
MLGTVENILRRMEQHAQILRPRFEAVLDAFDRELVPLNLAQFTRPKGGYFISVNLLDGCAKRAVSLCAEAGVKLTEAGATYPYGKDPRDRNIRIAPTYPSLDELKQALEVFCLCVKIASVEKIMQAGQ